MITQLLNDRELAKITSMSSGWVRNQRWRRKHGEDHALIIDAVMIGSTPRYRHCDVMAWVDGLEAAND